MIYQDFEHDLGQRDLGEAPAVNATGHLVFETANSLQHWLNTHYCVGHTIVPVTVPIDTLLYHGSSTGPHMPTALGWVAIEPDHSMLFYRGAVKTGCWHLTFTVTQPMKVLYFDGSSAAKPLRAPRAPKIVVGNDEWMCNEEQHIKDLCKWGQKYGVNGFVRMETNFCVLYI